MSTLSGLTSKGEKVKSKFQSLDINNLYKVCRGESSEKQQQKSSLQLKHGMQSLGKVPSARRAPVNLPSIKSEHSGNDTAVSLVPSGGAGWGKQEASPTPITSPPTTVNNTSVNTTTPTNTQINAHPTVVAAAAAVTTAALPVSTTVPPGNKHTSSVTSVTADKSWSSVMSGPDLTHPPPYQSPQFQHEFPSLSAGDGGQPRTGTDIQYGPGPSLRPQTEGSWIQGGSRGTAESQQKPNLAPPGVPPQLSAPVGLPPGQALPQYPVFAPPFMCRGNNYIANGHAGNTNVNNAPNAAINGRNRVENRGARGGETDELAHRPIIKEEDLNRMDDMRDMGWAANDDIDYNQKIAFSDDEGDKEIKRDKHISKEMEKTDSSPDGEQKIWSNARASSGSQDVRSRIRSSDEDEAIAQRRKQHSAEVALVISRAKQRKEEEEKRYLQTKMLAAKKLQELEEKLKAKCEKENDESQGTINPMSVPPQPITPSTIPVPDWEKEKDNRGKNEKTENVDEKSNKNSRESTSDFRQLTQIEGRNYARKDSTRSFDRDRESREQNGSSYVKFQNNLPPRFQRQQLRNNSTSSSQPPPFHQHETRWLQNNQNPSKQSPPSGGSRKTRDLERDMRRSDEYNRGSHRNNYSDSGHKSDNRYKDDDNNDYRSYDAYDYKRDEDKWEREREKPDNKQESFEESISSQSRQSSEEFHDKREKYVREDKVQERYDRPQRPDSRDSRASRDSRHSRESNRDSESKDYFSSWTTDVHLESSFEEKRKDQMKEDRRQVPGPITKDRIEADDLKSERRNLTQLKRGLIPEKKTDLKQDEKSIKDCDDAWDIRRSKETIESSKGWVSNSSNIIAESGGLEVNKFSDSKMETKNEECEKKSDKMQYENKEKDDKRNQSSRVRMDGNRNQGWSGGSSTVFRNSWSKRGSSRGSRSSGLSRSASNKNNEWHGTDSEISADEMSQSTDSAKDDKNRQSQRSPKALRKLDRDEKNKESKVDKISDRKMDKQENRKDYLPRGEPSRHGRGGSNFRGRGGGLIKRIDHYGPPPSRSPFSHSDEKDKKIAEESAEDMDDRSKHQSLTNLNKWKDSQNVSKSDLKGDDKLDKSKGRKILDNRRGKPKIKDGKLEDNDTTSENSDESASKDGKIRKSISKLSPSNRLSNSSQPRRNNAPPRLLNEKRSYMTGRSDVQNLKLNSSSTRSQPSKKDENSICTAIADIPLKNKDSVEDVENIECDNDEKSSLHGDSDGFQEVKSKKNGKERQKPEEKSLIKTNKIEKDNKIDRKGKSPSAQLSQQQIANIPPLMGTPVNPPPVMPQTSNKSTRLSKLPPRLVKQRENNRLQKQQMQQGICEINDISKVSQNISMYGIKDASNVMSVPISNAWEKPLTTTQLRNNIEPDSMLAVGIENCKSMDQAQSPNQLNVGDKVITKTIQEKAVLDGTSAPVNTIIFENTNFKSAPGPCVQRNSKTRSNKIEENSVETAVLSTFNKPISDVINKNEKQSSESSMIQINFNKEDVSDMKLDFIESEISYLTEDKATKNLGLPRSMHTITSSNTTISPSTADALNMKIASVKKVWENMPTVIEGQDDNSSFPSSFTTDPNSLDPSVAFSKGTDTPDDNHEVYSPSPNQAASNNTTNVCKVKPTQQVAGSVGKAVLTSVHQSHSAMVGGPGLMGHPLSPPPMQPVIGAGVGLGQPPQQFTANQHIGYQASLGGNTQYGVSAIPSPPTVLFNSTQQLQAQTGGLYAPFQIDQSQVLGGQGRSQYSQYPNAYNLGQTASSPYSAQSMYLQTAQPHPPTAQVPPDIYQSMNNYRLPASAPFGQNQQLNNPSTVLISSTSNSLMSATVKPSSQQISAIGTKASGVGQAFQQQSQTGQQLYMTYDPTLQANYIPSTGVMQRGPAGPVQNNVVPALQPSSSFYSGSTGAQTGYFQQPGSSTIQSAGPLQQHQTGYGIQGNVFGTHNQSHTNAGMQNLNSHFFSAPMQIAAINAQQYRSSNLPNTAYMKGVNNQQIGDQTGRSQHLKSPSGQQEVLSSVFNSDLKYPQSLQFLLSAGPQIPSPKSRQTCKQPPPQPSPTAQHKYNLYQNVGNQQSNQSQRYPTPIQRPVNYQSGLNSVQSNTGNPKHRSNQNNRPPPRQYYSSQGNSLSNQSDKTDDSKLNDNGSANTPNTTNATTANINKNAIGNSSQGTVNQTSDIVKEKEETGVIKD